MDELMDDDRVDELHRIMGQDARESQAMSLRGIAAEAARHMLNGNGIGLFDAHLFLIYPHPFFKDGEEPLFEEGVSFFLAHEAIAFHLHLCSE